MILKTNKHVLSQVQNFVQYLPNSANEREFNNKELLAKLFFFQVTGFTYEDFISAYHAYPNLVAQFQAEALVDHRFEISVAEPLLTSNFQRDFNGDITSGFMKLRINIRVTRPLEEGTADPYTMLYADFDVYTTETYTDAKCGTSNLYPKIQMTAHSALDSFQQRPSAMTDYFVGKNPVHYARALRTAIYTLVRDFADQYRPEIYSGKPRADDANPIANEPVNAS